MKLQMKNYNLKNCNIIPFCGDQRKPEIYKQMIKTHKNNRENTESDMTLLQLYREITKNNHSTMCAGTGKLHTQSLTSDERSNNYLIFMNALPTHDKVPKEPDKRCLFCKKSRETMVHLFIECPNAIRLRIKHHLTIKNETSTYDYIINHKNTDEKERKVISMYKLTIWKYRTRLKAAILGKKTYKKNLYLNL